MRLPKLGQMLCPLCKEILEVAKVLYPKCDPCGLFLYSDSHWNKKMGKDKYSVALDAEGKASVYLIIGEEWEDKRIVPLCVLDTFPKPSKELFERLDKLRLLA